MVASDGTEGVALFAEHKDEIAIVITDMMMPYMDGKMTIKALTRIKPNLKIIGMSGLMQNGRIFQEVESSNTLFIHKPFTTETLLIVIHQLLIK